MVTQLERRRASRPKDVRLPPWRYMTAAILGAFISVIVTITMPALAWLQLGAMWLLSFAISCVVVALLTRRIYGRSHWGMVIFGQVLGSAAVALLFMAAL